MEQIEEIKNKIRERVETQAILNDRYEGEINLAVIRDLGKKLFKELEVDYGILVPVEFDITKDDKGLDAVAIRTALIDGKNLDEVEKTPEKIEQIEGLYTNISKYFYDKFLNSDFFLTDINAGSQYVYGKKEGDEKPHIYLVDTDLYLGYGKIELLHTVMWLIRHLPEEECGKRFEQARKYIADIIYSPISSDINDEEKRLMEEKVSEAKLFFEGRGREWKGKDIGIINHEILVALNKI